MKALEGIKVLDFTHVQSGPTCTQLLAWFGADVIKVERPGVGDATRKQLVDVAGADSLYFTMLNHNKRSIELNSKNETGKVVLTRLIETCDVLVENFAPGALDRMGFTWERIQEINPRIIMASIKGFGPGKYEDCKVYENVAQCAGGSASTTGFRDGPPLVTGAQIGDSGTGLHLCLGIVTALFHREKTGVGQKVSAAMQDSVLNLARVKLRDQQRLEAGPLAEYSQYGEGIAFGDATPRAGNDSGGGQPGRILRCKGYEQDPNAYTYFIIQAAIWEKVCDVIGEPDWKTKDGYAKALSQEQLSRQRDAMKTQCAQSDIVITTAQLYGRTAPVILNDEILSAMKPGSVIVDLAAESGGNVSGSLAGEIVENENIIIVGAANLPGRYTQDASQMYASNLYAFFSEFYSTENQAFEYDPNDEILAACYLVREGEVIHPAFSQSV